MALRPEFKPSDAPPEDKGFPYWLGETVDDAKRLLRGHNAAGDKRLADLHKNHPNAAAMVDMLNRVGEAGGGGEAAMAGLLPMRRARGSNGEILQIPVESKPIESVAGVGALPSRGAAYTSTRGAPPTLAEQLSGINRDALPPQTTLNRPTPPPAAPWPTQPPAVDPSHAATHVPTGTTFPAGGTTGPGVLQREYPLALSPRPSTPPPPEYAMIPHPGTPPPLPLPGPRTLVMPKPIERVALSRPPMEDITPQKPRYESGDDSWIEPATAPPPQTPNGRAGQIKNWWKGFTAPQRGLMKVGLGAVGAASAVQLARLVNGANHAQQQQQPQRAPDTYDQDVKDGVLTAEEAAQLREYEAAHAH